MTSESQWPNSPRSRLLASDPARQVSGAARPPFGSARAQRGQRAANGCSSFPGMSSARVSIDCQGNLLSGGANYLKIDRDDTGPSTFFSWLTRMFAVSPPSSNTIQFVSSTMTMTLPVLFIRFCSPSATSVICTLSLMLMRSISCLQRQNPSPKYGSLRNRDSTPSLIPTR